MLNLLKLNYNLIVIYVAFFFKFLILQLMAQLMQQEYSDHILQTNCACSNIGTPFYNYCLLTIASNREVNCTRDMYIEFIS